MAKCCFKEWLYGPKNHWPEPPKAKEKEKENKKERVIFKAPHVMCECGFKSDYGLVPSELGIGHYCGHMDDYDEVGYWCGKYEIIFFSFAKTYDLIFRFNRALGNASGKLMMVKLGVDGS
jgi:hypothetical protein